MALPKRKTSKSRLHIRRGGQRKIQAPTTVICPQCKSTKLAHHACSVCGTYRGRQAVEVKSRKTSS